MNSAPSSKASGGQTYHSDEFTLEAKTYQVTLIFMYLNPFTRFSYLGPRSFDTCPCAIGVSSAKKRSVTLINLNKNMNNSI